ncbi:unnamed protein product [Closterium sp. NIES-64]|nr:unnamed protein product [Closterium sp. NIES-64]
MLILFVLLYDAADGFVVLLCCRIACCTMLLNQAIASGRPQLNRNKARMLGRTNSPAGPQDLYSAYDAALEEGIGPYAYVMRQHGLVPFPAWVHTALALPPRELDHSIVKPHYVHAVPVLHGKAAFSSVEFVDEQGKPCMDASTSFCPWRPLVPLRTKRTVRWRLSGAGSHRMSMSARGA